MMEELTNAYLEAIVKALQGSFVPVKAFNELVNRVDGLGLIIDVALLAIIITNVVWFIQYKKLAKRIFTLEEKEPDWSNIKGFSSNPEDRS